MGALGFAGLDVAIPKRRLRCAMGGSFGFEKGKYDISIACGERARRYASGSRGLDEQQHDLRPRLVQARLR